MQIINVNFLILMSNKLKSAKLILPTVVRRLGTFLLEKAFNRQIILFGKLK
ncbi:hypothetical protein GCM10019996_00070 [Lentilactobacillus parakefiri]